MVAVKDIDTYLAMQSEPVRNALEHLRKVIKSVAPDAEEVISYGMPAFKQYRVLVGFAAFKDHCSFFPWGAETIERFKEELAGFSLSKGTIRFTTDKPLPDELVKKIVQAKMKTDEAKRLSKGK